MLGGGGRGGCLNEGTKLILDKSTKQRKWHFSTVLSVDCKIYNAFSVRLMTIDCQYQY